MMLGMNAVLKMAWNAPVLYAPFTALALLGFGWLEHLSQFQIPWLWLVPITYACIRLPRHGGILQDAKTSEFNPTLSELVVSVLGVLTIALALIMGWNRDAGGGLFIYPAIGLGLLYLRMVQRSRDQLPRFEECQESP